jgi:hypothetical protein
LRNGKQLADNFKGNKGNDLTVVVINFVDMLSHAKTEMEVIKELASDDKAYRSLTLSWFKNSPLLEMLKEAQNMGMQLIITTDHGTIRVQDPIKVIGDKNISLNLRYKQGKNLRYNAKEVFEVKDPDKAMLPKPNLSTSYIFPSYTDFFAYPNNYNHYVSYYRDTFQHGGISLEEMLIPFVVLQSRK